MILWIDAQLSPSLAPWISEQFPNVQAFSARYLGLRDATDRQIFDAAREVSAIVMTKDHDFVQLLDQYGPPPQVLWITCGNTSNARMRQILTHSLNPALKLLSLGERLVEISDAGRA